jgi:hypothetical protein
VCSFGVQDLQQGGSRQAYPEPLPARKAQFFNRFKRGSIFGGLGTDRAGVFKRAQHRAPGDHFQRGGDFMKKSLLGAAMLVLALTAVIAEDSTITGKVVSVDPTGNIFVVESGMDRYTFTANTSTMYMSGGQHLNLSDIKVGDQVSIRGTGTGMSRTATEVTVTAAAGTSYGSSGSSTTTTTTTPGSNYSGTSNYNDTTGTTGTSGATTTTTTTTTDTTNNSAYANDTNANGTLPRTGSPAPLIGFAGLLLVGFSLAIRAARRIAH